jgi:hypothetical protein
VRWEFKKVESVIKPYATPPSYIAIAKAESQKKMGKQTKFGQSEVE